ncbi:MAG: flagellar basal-body rod protein FlgF [Alphaproteobacteria bacterium]|nr:flagellar basal-body rod protein FlgF [Alphaproteobacteria bacterium]
MDNSLLISLSQQIAAYRSMDVIANNLANVSTPGFKRESAKFEEYVQMVRPAEGQSGPQAVSFVKDAGTSRDISQGNITSTGAPLDLALNGKGFFTIATPAGERYTRDGHFSLNQDGQIVTSEGYALQGEGGAITITPTDGEIHVAADGTISSVVNGTLNQLGKLRLTDFANERTLAKEGANLFAANGVSAAPATATVAQGSLESSNVQPVLEISKMIEVMRAYEATATLSKSQEDMSRDAITKLGTMPN